MSNIEYLTQREMVLDGLLAGDLAAAEKFGWRVIIFVACRLNGGVQVYHIKDDSELQKFLDYKDPNYIIYKVYVPAICWGTPQEIFDRAKNMVYNHMRKGGFKC